MDHFLIPEGGFESFQAFFTRALSEWARPIDADSDSIVFPADARHLAFNNVEEATGFYVK